MVDPSVTQSAQKDAPTLFSRKRDYENKDVLSSLNARQREAVEKIYGTVLVLAGPGTGKTHMLTSRIAHILQQTDLSAQNILCLTFTENGAVEMRNRLAKWAGKEAYRVAIHTFHGFCEKVLQDYPETFAKEKAQREIADDLDKALVFRKVIESKKWKHFRPFGDNFFWHRRFTQTLSDLKKENLSPGQLRPLIPDEKRRLEAEESNYYQRDSKWGKKGDMKPQAKAKIENNIEKMEEFCDLWEMYEAEMKAQNLYDFDDQILWVVGALEKDPTLKAELQERYQFVLVDEYQDTNASQNAILWHLADTLDEPNLFGVGDDDQCIYRFQGASLENITEFEQKFPQASVIALTENYRSAQKILDGAYACVEHNLERKLPDKSLQASGDNKTFPGHIEKASLGSRFSEITFLAHKIRAEMEQGVSPSEIAVLCRENREVRELAEYLPKFDIPVSSQLAENIFEDPKVSSLVSMMEFFAHPDQDHHFLELLHARFWDIDAKELFTLSAEGAQDLKSLMGRDTSPQLQKAIKLFVEGRKDYLTAHPSAIAEHLFHHSGLFGWVESETNDQRISDLMKFRKLLGWMREKEKKEAPKKLGLEDILEKIRLHQELGISLPTDKKPSDERAITIMTAHRAKGSEFEVVFLPGLLERVWGDRRKHGSIPLPALFHDTHDPNEEERRLFFVALTRAKKKLYLSHAQQDFGGRDRSPSLFWHEVPDEVCAEAETKIVEDQAANLLPVFFATQSPQFTDQETNILQSLARKHVWSATSLQDFLDCPRKFLYVHLLRLPRPKNKHLILGTALHAVLEQWHRHYQQSGEVLNLEMLLADFEKTLRSQFLTSTEREESLLHGKELLTHYYQQRQDSLSQNVLLEMNFREKFVKVGDIPVTGKVDKIELSPDKKTATFVDYKSGKPKSLTKGERYWRQLVFYDLLARHAKGLGFRADRFVLEFLTPDAKGQIVRKEIEIGEEDRSQVSDELKQAHQKILALDFPLVENFEGDEEVAYWQRFGK